MVLEGACFCGVDVHDCSCADATLVAGAITVDQNRGVMGGMGLGESFVLVWGDRGGEGGDVVGTSTSWQNRLHGTGVEAE